MKKMIKSTLLIGFLGFQMMYPADLGFLEKLRVFLDRTSSNPLTYFMVKIADEINKEQKGELWVNLKKNNSLVPDTQLDNAIEYVVPYMDNEQKLNLCRLINQYRKENKNENIFSSQFKNAKIVDIQINDKSNENDLIIIENNNKKYEIIPNRSFCKRPYAPSTNFSATDQFLYTLFEDKIDKMDELIDCSQCYADFITNKR